MSLILGCGRKPILSIVAVLSLMDGCSTSHRTVQPVPFSHRQHAAKKLKCVFCHSGAEKYSQASIPGVVFCMSCHSVVKSDTAEVLRVKAYLERREEIPWRRVYGFSSHANVFFNHRRHAFAGIDCAFCHGQVEDRDELGAEVKHTMATCLRCHRTNRQKFRPPALADDCATCHR